MSSYTMTCTCGHAETVDAASREEAVARMRSLMTQDYLDDHMRQYHRPDEPKPTLEQAREMVDQMIAVA